MTKKQNAPFLKKIVALRPPTFRTKRVKLHYGQDAIGWVSPAIINEVKDTFFTSSSSRDAHLSSSNSLRNLGDKLAARGLYKPFNEMFDVLADDRNMTVGQVDRGAVPLLGLTAEGVHVNGFVEKAGELFLWIGHRATHKRLDPGKLDHLVAGGKPAGLSPRETLIKEAAEEAGITSTMSSQASFVSKITYVNLRPEGLRRDTLHCYDLKLPDTFVPRAVDGEVDYFELMSVNEALNIVRESDRFKFNVDLVLIDFFIRHGAFPDSQAESLRKALFHPIKLEGCTI